MDLAVRFSRRLSAAGVRLGRSALKPGPSSAGGARLVSDAAQSAERNLPELAIRPDMVLAEVDSTGESQRAFRRT
jgi:hypothetical protein